MSTLSENSCERLGWEFELDPTLLNPIGRSYDKPYDGAFATGRAALAAILRHAQREESARTVFLPNYICSSVIDAVRLSEMDAAFYPVNSFLDVDVQNLFTAIEELSVPPVAVVVVDYFGMSTCTSVIDAIKSFCPEITVIRDNVQSLFSMNHPGREDYSFSSLRKWLPVPDGATTVWPAGAGISPTVKEADFVAYRLLAGLEAHWDRMPLSECSDAIRYSTIAERMVDELGIFPAQMSLVSKIICSNLCMDQIVNTRRANFLHLRSLLSPHGIKPILDMRDSDVPHFMPIRIPSRDKVRRELQRAGIFCPVHWPRPTDQKCESNNALWDEELSLIVDQRYGPDDMLRQSTRLLDSL